MKQLEEGQRFGLGLGETHDKPTHVMAEQLIISRLMDEGIDLRVAFESSAVGLARILKNNLSISCRDEDIYRIADFDHSTGGYAGLHASFAFWHIAYSLISQKNLMAFCLKQGLKTLQADAGDVQVKDQKGKIQSFVDLNDPCLPDEVRSDKNLQIPCDSDYGVQLRSLAMAMRIVYAETPFVLPTGSSHLFNDEGSTYTGSLHHLFSHIGTSFLPVMLDVKDCIVPEDCPAQALKEAIMIEGLDSTEFNSTVKGYDTRNEYRHLRRIFDASNNEIGEFNFEFKEAKDNARLKIHEFLVAANKAGFNFEIPPGLNPDRPKGWGERIRSWFP